MRLKETRAGKWSMLRIFKGQKKGVKYEITETLEGDYYVMAHDTKRDSTLNSLWIGLRFKTVEDAHKWCEKEKDIEELRDYYLNNKAGC